MVYLLVGDMNACRFFPQLVEAVVSGFIGAAFESPSHCGSSDLVPNRSVGRRNVSLTSPSKVRVLREGRVEDSLAEGL
jgi:hypothetical protein